MLTHSSLTSLLGNNVMAEEEITLSAIEMTCTEQNKT